MKRHVCLAVSLLPILLAFAMPVFGDDSKKENINYFEAVFQHGNVSINWQISGQVETPTEIDYFAIERKHTVNNYLVIGGLKEKVGISGQREYFFEDGNPPVKPHIQYRLKVVFKDGSVVYSHVRNIFQKEVTELEITPIPFNEKINVSLPVKESFPFQIKIFNYNGEEVFRSNYEGKSEELLQLELDVSELLPGVYIFSLTNGAKSWQKKILKK